MLLTYGHGTESAERTVATLRGAGVSSLVDIRTAPGSRRNPQFARAAMEEWLPEAGIAYRWEKRLGGFCRPSAGNPDVAWHEDMFRGYAEHMRSADFRAAIEAVLAEAAAAEAGSRLLTVMCSETLWWRCHRRLVADFVSVARGIEVRHLMHDGRVEAHRSSPGLRLRDDGLLVYDSGQPTLLLRTPCPGQPAAVKLCVARPIGAPRVVDHFLTLLSAVPDAC
jgi:uncharacterized protein (DUF488 family)